MSLTFGLALLRIGLMDALRRNGRLEGTLAACGMRVEARGTASFDPDVDLSEDTQLTVVTALPGLEVWSGFPVAYMVERMQQTSPPLPGFSGLFIGQEGGSGTFMHQFIEKGRYGAGGAYPVRKNGSWHRTFPIDQGMPPQSQWHKTAQQSLATEIGAPLALVARAYMGLSGGGFRGLTWCAEQNAWVLARSLADTLDHFPAQAQELNPNSYAKRGKPFAVAPTKGNLPGFLPQSVLFYEIQHRAIAAALGARLDSQDGLDLLRGQPCQRYDLWLERSTSRTS